MKNTFKKVFYFGVVSLLLYLALSSYSVVREMGRIEYDVSNSIGQNFSETWEDKDGEINIFNRDKKLVAQTFFEEKEGIFEERNIEFSQKEKILLHFPKNPTQSEEAFVKGEVFFLTNKGEVSSKGEAVFISSVRPFDRRIVSVVSYNLNAKEIFLSTRLFSNKEKSSYYFPDERIDQILVSGKVVDTVHFKAKGRHFFPIEYKHNRML